MPRFRTSPARFGEGNPRLQKSTAAAGLFRCICMLCEPAPADINGDLPLTSSERAAYMRHHAERNRLNAEASRGVRTSSGPRPSKGSHAGRLSFAPGSTPGRVATIEFFTYAASVLAPRFAGRELTIVDIGAGGGVQLDPFLEAGFAGRYIGIDIVRSPRWREGPSDCGRFSRELIVCDVNRLDAELLPPIDLLISNTALEHIKDDAGAIRSLSTRLAPGAAQVHFVPGEESLELYGPHGHRQYSPRCLLELFPGGEIFRYGGAASGELHRQWISPATRTGACPRDEDPQAYRRLRDLALDQDEHDGHVPASMYGVIA